MRRHGEPLMIMPDWREPTSHDRFDEPQTERGHIPHDAESSEEQLFEFEALPFRLNPEPRREDHFVNPRHRN